MQKKAKIEEEEERHRERLKFLDEEFTRLNKAAKEEIATLEEKRRRSKRSIK